MSKSKSGRRKGAARAKYKRRRLWATGVMKHIVRRKQKRRNRRKG